MGVPIWLPARPWRIETPGVEVTKTEQDQERVIKAETSAGTLIARWVVGPDGDWWQTEYPVKTPGRSGRGPGAGPSPELRARQCRIGGVKSRGR